jgi:hypothetical protein
MRKSIRRNELLLFENSFLGHTKIVNGKGFFLEGGV